MSDTDRASLVKWLREQQENEVRFMELAPTVEVGVYHTGRAAKLAAAIALIESQAAREKDRRESERRVMLEPCDASEVHCTCVPVLRKALAAERECRRELAEALHKWGRHRASCWETYQTGSMSFPVKSVRKNCGCEVQLALAASAALDKE